MPRLLRDGNRPCAFEPRSCSSLQPLGPHTLPSNSSLIRKAFMNSRVSKDFPGIFQYLATGRERLIRKRHTFPTRPVITLAIHTREKSWAEGWQKPIRVLQAAE